MSQFGGMCAKLGIELIGANSAQAKGRVERGHGTHQDRLIKKMHLKKIATFPYTLCPMRKAERPPIKGQFYRGKNGDISIEVSDKTGFPSCFFHSRSASW